MRGVSAIPDPSGEVSFDRERDLGALTSLEDDLAAVEIALRRLDDGTYGTCEVCRASIGEEVADDPLVRRCEAHTGGLPSDPV